MNKQNNKSYERKRFSEIAALSLVIRDHHPELLGYDLATIKDGTPDFVFENEGIGFEITELTSEKYNHKLNKEKKAIKNRLEAKGIDKLHIHLTPHLVRDLSEYERVSDDVVTLDNYMSYLKDRFIFLMNEHVARSGLN